MYKRYYKKSRRKIKYGLCFQVFISRWSYKHSLSRGKRTGVGIEHEKSCTLYVPESYGTIWYSPHGGRGGFRNVWFLVQMALDYNAHEMHQLITFCLCKILHWLLYAQASDMYVLYIIYFIISGDKSNISDHRV